MSKNFEDYGVIYSMYLDKFNPKLINKYLLSLLIFPFLTVALFYGFSLDEVYTGLFKFYFNIMFIVLIPQIIVSSFFLVNSNSLKFERLHLITIFIMMLKFPLDLYTLFYLTVTNQAVDLTLVLNLSIGIGALLFIFMIYRFLTLKSRVLNGGYKHLDSEEDKENKAVKVFLIYILLILVFLVAIIITLLEPFGLNSVQISLFFLLIIVQTAMAHSVCNVYLMIYCKKYFKEFLIEEIARNKF